jgi:hypothetical protein
LLRINQQTLFPVAEAVRTAYLEAGASVAVLLPIRLRGQFGFGGNPRSVAAVQQITSEMTEYLSQSTTEAVREAIIRAVDTGVPPAETARDLVGLMDRRTGIRSGGIMNLDAQRAEQAQKVKDMLGDKDKIRRYFIKDSKTGKMKPRYKSTDRTFDKRIREAIKAGRALPKSDIDAISNRHISRLLLDRGKQIARDNTLTALRSGRHNGFIELVESGGVLDEQIERSWLNAGDARVRDDHQVMNGQKRRGMNTPYTFPDGSQGMYPGDRSLGAPIEQTTHCRCAEIFRIIPRSKLEADQ